jgi:tRNA (cmo5U34)-methyltransferase
MSDAQDHVGNGIVSPNSAWTFGGSVADHFEEHIKHSIPFYLEGHELVCQISDFFVRSESVCYELGTSLGDLTSKLCIHHHHRSNVKWVAIDNELEMIEKAKTRHQNANIQFVHADGCLFDFQKSDFIVAYYTVQFVQPRLRQELINKLYEALNWGGALLMFEKVRGADARFQDILTSLYTDFKLENGYTSDQILAKSRSLKGILEPFSTQGNLDLLTRAGFKDVMTVMKYLCFEGFLAIK